MTPVLQCENIRFAYAGQAMLLSDISFHVAAGEIVGLVGPNGAGKSTLLKLIKHTLKPLRGKCLVQGEDAAGVSRRELARRVSFVPQRVEVPFAFTALELVLMGRHAYAGPAYLDTADDYALAFEALQLAGIEALAEKEYTGISGGEQQLVLLARAIAQHAPLMLLDEPLTFLDIRRQWEILQVLTQLRAQGSAVLITLHDLNVAAHYCDRILMLSGGTIVAQGIPGVVLNEALLEQAYGMKLEITHDASGRVHVQLPY